MRLIRELLAAEKGISNWLYIGGGGLIVVIIGIFIFVLPSDTTDTSTDDPDSIVNQEPALDPIPDIPLELSVTELITNEGLAGRGDIPMWSGPPSGNFEIVDQGFQSLTQVNRGTTPHWIVANNGSPPVESYLPISLKAYNANNGNTLWDLTLEGDPIQICRGPDGCSMNGEELNDDILIQDAQGACRVLVQASSGDHLIAEAGLLSTGPGCDTLNVVGSNDLIIGGPGSDGLDGDTIP